MIGIGQCDVLDHVIDQLAIIEVVAVRGMIVDRADGVPSTAGDRTGDALVLPCHLGVRLVAHAAHVVNVLRFLHPPSLLDWKTWLLLPVSYLPELLLPIQLLWWDCLFLLQPFKASWWPHRRLFRSNSSNGGQSFDAVITTRKVTACVVISAHTIMAPIRSSWKMSSCHLS